MRGPGDVRPRDILATEQGPTPTDPPAVMQENRARVDPVVLDRNVFDPGAGPIGDARVVLTLVEGEAVYTDPDLSF